MLKRLVLGAGITLVALNLTGCFGGNPYTKHKDDKWYSTEYAFYVANELLGDKFNSERKEVADELKDHEDIKKLRKNSDGSYSITQFKGTPWKNYTDKGFYYVGELDDNKPDGIGTLYEKQYSDEYLSPIYSGEWEDGMYNGYGQYYTRYYYNHRISLLTYEGSFEDGKPNGEGIDYYITETTNVDKGTFVLTYAEDFDERLKADGNVKKFVDGVLVFEAKIDRDSGYAKGKEYYKNGELKYKGEFKNGSYHGDGVLYDENGKEIYDGEWERGDYK